MANLFKQFVASWMVLALLTSCAPYSLEGTQTRAAYRDPDHAASTKKSTSSIITGTTSLSGTVLSIHADWRRTCTKTTEHPMVADQVSERKLTDVGRDEQTILLIGAAVAVIAGVSFLSDPCALSRKNSGESNFVCTSNDKRQGEGIGAGLITIGAGSGAWFVGNALNVQGQEEKRIARPPVQKESTMACGTSPARNTAVVVAVAGQTLNATTGKTGSAEVELSGLEPTADFGENPTAAVRVGEFQIGTVNLRELPIFEQAKSAMLERQQEKAEADKKAQAAMLEREHEKVEAAKAACETNYDQCDTSCAREHLACVARKKCTGIRCPEDMQCNKFDQNCLKRCCTIPPKRDLQNPSDIRALQLASREHTQCLLGCVDDVQVCIDQAPEVWASSEHITKAQYVDTHCNPPYEACQVVCESIFNSAGFCLEKNAITGADTGAMGVCP